MDPEILNKLNAYCSKLIGEKPLIPEVKKPIKKIGKSSKASQKEETLIQKKDSTAMTLVASPQKKPDPLLKVTDDGFKVVTEIPEDDSDISDAFSTDLEDEYYESSNSNTLNSQKVFRPKLTEDGFKIVPNICADDSDVSDAFESDIDESDWLSEAQHRIKMPPKHENSKKENEPKFQTIKKPLMKLIQDFDMQDQVFFNKKSKPCLKRSLPVPPETKSKKCLSTKEMIVMDYSSRRGKTKVEEIKNDEKEKKTKEHIKESQEKDFKKARYDVFKFGLSAFDKHEQDNVKIEMAIKLGAKAPRKKCVNYKKYKEERKLEKQNEIKKRTDEREMGIMTKKPVENKPRKRDDIGNNLPIGKFKNGMLSLSKKDIASINSKR